MGTGSVKKYVPIRHSTKSFKGIIFRLSTRHVYTLLKVSVRKVVGLGISKLNQDQF